MPVDYLRKSSNPVLFRSVVAVEEAETVPPTTFTVLNDSQWNKGARTPFPSASLYRKLKFQFTQVTKADPDDTCTVQVWVKDAAGNKYLRGSSSVVAGADNIDLADIDLGDAFNYSIAVVVSAVAGAELAEATNVTFDAMLVGYNPNLDS